MIAMALCTARGSLPLAISLYMYIHANKREDQKGSGGENKRLPSTRRYIMYS